MHFLTLWGRLNCHAHGAAIVGELAGRIVDAQVERAAGGWFDRGAQPNCDRRGKGWVGFLGALIARIDCAKQYAEWAADKNGVYTSNGGVVVIAKKSRPVRPIPDLFCLGLLANFQGYFPGYSELISRDHNYLSWIVLKAHTMNKAGRVTLRSN